jgi:hypothetical protein
MKTIKLTNEIAAALYNKDPELRTTLLHEFTDEELGIKPKPLRWEDLEGIEGCYIEQDSTYRMTNGTLMNMPCNRNVYPCLKDAEKALAHCQLLQLAKYYNKCEQHEIEEDYYSPYYDDETKEIKVSIFISLKKYGDVVKFKYKSDLENCIEDNRDLWEIYLGVK